MPTLTGYPVADDLPEKPRFFWKTVFLAIVAVFFFYILFNSSFFQLKYIVVQGNRHLKEKDIIRLAGINPGINIFQADLRQGRANLLTHPLIKKATLYRRLPATVVIDITEREPIAVISDRDRFLLVDEEGYCLEIKEGLLREKLPFLTGKGVRSGRPGEKIVDSPGQLGLNYLVALAPDLREKVAEVHVASSQNVIFYMADHYQVRFGGIEKLGEKVKLLENILAVAPKGELLEYIDLRDPLHPVKKVKEQSSAEKRGEERSQEKGAVTGE